MRRTPIVPKRHKHSWFRFSPCSIAASLGMSAALAARLALAGEPDEPLRFNRDVRPILSDACYACHGPDSDNRQADLRLDRREGLLADLGGYQAVVPGKPDESLLIERISAADAEERMPPPDAARHLTSAEIETLRRWIEQGATYEEHWSFVPPERGELPAVKDSAWTRNAIDHFVLSALEIRGLTPSQEASRETLIRRLTLDLTGLPPTPAEVDAFLADQSATAYESVVDRLLASPRFGEHWAWPWLDAARYSDTNGYQQDGTRTMWPWRDWVVDALNRNLPFDQFTVWQLAGDLLPDATVEQRLATGFHRNHMLNGEGGRIPEESRVEYVLDRVETTGTVWLGLTIGCARCHDHKYDPIQQQEFYQLYAYFNNVDETGEVNAGGNAHPVMLAASSAEQAELDDLSHKLAALDRRIESAADAERQAAWEASALAAVDDGAGQTVWSALHPVALHSAHEQTMTCREDNSVLVSGPNPTNDVYTVTLECGERRITGLRLDVLHDAQFTNRGLARSDSGNFVLTGFEVAIDRAGDGEPEAIKVAAAVADYEQRTHLASTAIDDSPETGWAVYTGGDMQQDRAAVFSFATPAALGADDRLIVRLKHESPHKHHNIGLFQLSATEAARPELDGNHELPTRVLAALRTPRDGRSGEQRQALYDFFLSVDAELSAIRAERDALVERKQAIETAAPRVMVMRDLDEPRPAYVLKVGAYDQPDLDRPVSPGVPEALPPLPPDAPADRVALARWLVSPEHPLTARVAVNRYWQALFGEGLVKTSEDFGSQGELPSHPELLDWLACEYMANGWDTKALLKTIVMSAVYRQSSVAPAELIRDDPQNRLLARGARFRLPSSVLRDQALALAGLLSPKAGGPPVQPYQPEGVWEDFSLGKISYEQDHGEDLYRRSLYVFWRRSVAPTSFFDTATRQVCAVRTARTNTPLHSLTTLNDTAYVEAARKMADRVLREAGPGLDERIEYAFRLALARLPSPAEASVLRRSVERLLREYRATPTAAEDLLTVGEAPRDPEFDPAETAAYAGAMSVILNLDETLTRE